MPHPIVIEEQDLLARVASRLEELGEPQSPSEAPIVRDLKQIREQILSRSDSKDSAALIQQWHRQSALLEQLRVSRGAPRVDPLSPYFAHLRLREADGDREICLGRATCIDHGIRIVDWRNAPISRIFYRYRQGESFEETLGDRVRDGLVVARRTVVIRDGSLEQIDAPEGRFTADETADAGWRRSERDRPRLAGGEASALRARDPGAAGRLGGDAGGKPFGFDKRLTEVTGLIDPEQFEVITRPAAGFLVIRGAAGSGKTTVALHRIAYLAFDDSRIDSPQTLVVVFSPALRNYVGHVLPSLGLQRVQISTFQEWVADQRRRHFPKLPRSVREDTPAWVQRLKLHPAMGIALATQVKRTKGSGPQQALDDWASVLTQSALLSEVCTREAPGEFSQQEIERFADWNHSRNEELFARLEGDSDSPAELDPEDDALLLRAWQLRVGPLRGHGRRPLRYRHIAIDEVQDFSPIEVQVLLDCLPRNGSITLAGDTQQHVIETSGFTSWNEFLEQLGVRGNAIDTLRVSYRSTREILDFAMELLGDLREDDEVPVATRSGPLVDLFRFTDRGACVAFLADALMELAREEPLASVAILTPSREASVLYHRGLANSDLPGLRLISNYDFTFAPGVEVTEIEQVKGLEFDYVVLVDVTAVDYPDLPGARRRLHVGATRAIHQLWLTSVGTPSSLVGSVGRNT